MRIRPARPADLEALLAVSLATGDAGRDASGLYRDGRLMGLIYVAPYLALARELAFVAQDDEGVAGFAVGARDTAAFEARLERDWWPGLRAAHPMPAGDPAGWSPDERRIARFHAPRRVPEGVVRRFPAHLHLNLLPRARRRGLGRALFETWRQEARRAEATAGAHGEPPALHVGVNPANAGGLAFWARLGFRRLPEADAAQVWMGLEGG